MGDCRQSGEQLRAEAIRRGLALARIVVFLGDGAAWIWENARLFFPTAIQILDFHHAVKHLGVLSRALYGDGQFGREQQKLWASELKARTSKPPGKPDGPLSPLAKPKPTTGPWPHDFFVMHPSGLIVSSRAVTSAAR